MGTCGGVCGGEEKALTDGDPGKPIDRPTTRSDKNEFINSAVIAQLFNAGKHREATEILVEHIMLVSPGAAKEMILEGRKFDDRGELVDWYLCGCEISQLPKSFGALVCSGTLKLSNNTLQSLCEGFGNITVGGTLHLSNNQLQSLPEGFGNITVGKHFCLNENQLQSLPEGFENITVGGNLTMRKNSQLTEYPSSFPNVRGDVHTNVWASDYPR